MPKTFILLLLLTWICGPVAAQTTQDSRRVEEIKRKSLKNSEIETGAKPSIENEVTDKNAFFKTLAHEDIVSLEDVVYIMVVLLKQDEAYPTFVERYNFLFDQGFLPESLMQEGIDQRTALTKGEYAFILLQVLDISGGLTLHVTGPTERYAFKEMQFQGFMGGGNADELMPGSWAVYAFIQAIEFLDEHNPTP